MFGWFKKKPETYSFIGNLNEPFDDFEAHAAQYIPSEEEQAATKRQNKQKPNPIVFESDAYDELSVFDTPIDRDDGSRWPLSDLAEEFLSEHPDYNIGHNDDPVFFRLILAEQGDHAREEAEQVINDDQARYGMNWSEQEKEQMIKQREKELLYARLYAVQTKYYLQRVGEYNETTSQRRHDETIAAINRSAVAANALDAAKGIVSAHPFLTGLIGTAMYHKLKGK